MHSERKSVSVVVKKRRTLTTAAENQAALDELKRVEKRRELNGRANAPGFGTGANRRGVKRAVLSDAERQEVKNRHHALWLRLIGADRLPRALALLHDRLLPMGCVDLYTFRDDHLDDLERCLHSEIGLLDRSFRRRAVRGHKDCRWPAPLPLWAVRSATPPSMPWVRDMQYRLEGMLAQLHAWLYPLSYGDNYSYLDGEVDDVTGALTREVDSLLRAFRLRRTTSTGDYMPPGPYTFLPSWSPLGQTPGP